MNTSWIGAYNPKYSSATALCSTIARYTWNVLLYTGNITSQQKEINIINFLHYVTALHIDPKEWQVLCVIALWKSFSCLIASSVLNTQIFHLVMPGRDVFSRHVGIALQNHTLVLLLPARVPLNSVKLFFPADTQLWNSSRFSLVAHRKSEIRDSPAP